MSSLVHAIRILNCFSTEEPELRLSEISRRLNLSKSNTHRLLGILTQEGLLRRDPDSVKYRLGLRLYELGYLALNDLDPRPALPRMLELSRVTQETVLLGVLSDWEVVYVQRVESPRILRVSYSSRFRAPVHATATGKALLAWRTKEDIDRVINHGLPQLSERTITDPERFRKALADVRRLGYAVSDQERESYTRTVAAPVRDEEGRVIAALTVAAPSQRLTRALVPRMASLVMQAAADLSSQLHLSSLARARGRRQQARLA